MKRIFFLVFVLTIFKIYSQNNLDWGDDFINTIDTNVRLLKTNSKANSVSIGIVKNGKIFTKNYGEIDKGKGNIANNETYFEIASITKLFTGQLLAKAVIDGKIKLDSDVRDYLKDDYPNLEFKGVPIKIKDLISYKTALPRSLPDESEMFKNMDESLPYRLNSLYEKYSKEQFFQDLKKIKLDTIPGFKHDYSNLSLELTAIILENVYKESFQEQLKKNIFSKIGLVNTKFSLEENETLANGYSINNVLMPHFINNLWGSGGFLKSNMNDLTKFLKYELENSNVLIQESQRNVENSKENWHGYFWDDFYVTENGKFGYKHGGAYGTNTLFAVFPEKKLGICIIINVNGENSFDTLINSIRKISNDLETKITVNKKIEGYKITKNDIVFVYKHDEKLNSKLINSISVAGSFNNWNPNDEKFKMQYKRNNIYELKIPKIYFQKNKEYQFKFVINKVAWVDSPLNAFNVEKSDDRNLILIIK